MILNCKFILRFQPFYRDYKSNEASENEENETESQQDDRKKKQRTYGLKDPSPGRFRGNRGSEER